MNRLAGGVAAGLAGTVAYTATGPGRGRSATAAGSATSAPVGRAARVVLHWGYGAWGGVLGALLPGRRWPLHLAAFWLPQRVARARPPLLVDLARHAVYVGVTGAVYRRLA